MVDLSATSHLVPDEAIGCFTKVQAVERMRMRRRHPTAIRCSRPCSTPRSPATRAWYMSRAPHGSKPTRRWRRPPGKPNTPRRRQPGTARSRRWSSTISDGTGRRCVFVRMKRGADLADREAARHGVKAEAMRTATSPSARGSGRSSGSSPARSASSRPTRGSWPDIDGIEHVINLDPPEEDKEPPPAPAHRPRRPERWATTSAPPDQEERDEENGEKWASGAIRRSRDDDRSRAPP